MRSRPTATDWASTALQVRVGVVTGRAAATDQLDEGIVVGDRVNTAARIQSIAAPGTVLVDCDDARRHERRDRLQRRRAARPEGQGRARAGVAGGAGDRRCPRHPPTGRSGSRARRTATASCGCSRSCSTRPSIAGRQGSSRSSGRQASASRDWPGSSTSMSTVWRPMFCGTAAGASRMATAWRIGRWRRWSVSASASPRQDSGAVVVRRRLGEGLERWVASVADREFIEPRLAQLLGASDGHLQPRRTVRRVAVVLRTASRRGRRSCCWSTISIGPTRVCSTSSTACSTGLPLHPILVVDLGPSGTR